MGIGLKKNGAKCEYFGELNEKKLSGANVLYGAFTLMTKSSCSPMTLRSARNSSITQGVLVT